MKKTSHFFNNDNPLSQQRISTILEKDKADITQTMADFNIQSLGFFIPFPHYGSIEASKLGFADLNLIVTGDMTLLEFTAFSKYLLKYFPETDVEFFTYKTLNQMLTEKSKQLSITDDTVVNILGQVIDSIKPVINESNGPNPPF